MLLILLLAYCVFVARAPRKTVSKRYDVHDDWTSLALLVAELRHISLDGGRKTAAVQSLLDFDGLPASFCAKVRTAEGTIQYLLSETHRFEKA